MNNKPEMRMNQMIEFKNSLWQVIGLTEDPKHLQLTIQYMGENQTDFMNNETAYICYQGAKIPMHPERLKAIPGLLEALETQAKRNEEQ